MLTEYKITDYIEVHEFYDGAHECISITDGTDAIDLTRRELVKLKEIIDEILTHT